VTTPTYDPDDEDWAAVGGSSLTCDLTPPLDQGANFLASRVIHYGEPKPSGGWAIPLCIANRGANADLNLIILIYQLFGIPLTPKNGGHRGTFTTGFCYNTSGGVFWDRCIGAGIGSSFGRRASIDRLHF